MKGNAMAGPPERIEQLIERSSLGAPDARRARAQVTTATARALLIKVKTTPVSPVRALRSSRSAITGRFSVPRGKSSC
ncbi:MAG: hypothetical protein ACREX8_18180 [Gammaproteobacteria bacterium]